MAKYDDLDTKQIFIIGIASVAVTAVTILAVQYVYFLLVDGHQSRLQAESNYNRQIAVLDEQVDSISAFGADPATGSVTIPIEQAMELIAKEAESQTHSDDANTTDAT